MDTTTPKLNLTKNTTRDFKVRTIVKAGEAAGPNSIVKIRWTSLHSCYVRRHPASSGSGRLTRCEIREGCGRPEAGIS